MPHVREEKQICSLRIDGDGCFIKVRLDLCLSTHLVGSREVEHKPTKKRSTTATARRPKKACRIDDFLRPATARACKSTATVDEERLSAPSGCDMSDGSFSSSKQKENDERIKLSDERADKLKALLLELRQQIAAEKSMKRVDYVISKEGINHLVIVSSRVIWLVYSQACSNCKCN